MKAIFTFAAAILVSTMPWSAASAQYPMQYPGYAMPASYAATNGTPADGAPAYAGATGGCASGDCGKFSVLHKLGIKKGGCAGGCNGNGCNGGFCAALKGLLCRPYPSNAPRFGKPDYPLGFPTHPYMRSPRDYFLDD